MAETFPDLNALRGNILRGNELRQQGKIEGAEDAEKPPRYRIIGRQLMETHEDGSTTERLHECNGHSHRESVQRISPGARGDFDFVKEISREDRGRCHGNHS